MGTTEMIFILDRSGSMDHLVDDTIGGFNSMIEKQRELEGEVKVSTVLFDHEIEWLFERISLDKVRPLTRRQYYTRGSTALLDAVGFTVKRLQETLGSLKKKKQPDHVIIVITTDGYENTSRYYTYPLIKDLIQTMQEKYGWEFLFLGANIDAQQAAGSIGIHSSRAANYHADAKGVEMFNLSVSEALISLRRDGTVRDDWKDQVDRDYKSRRKR